MPCWQSGPPCGRPHNVMASASSPSNSGCSWWAMVRALPSRQVHHDKVGSSPPSPSATEPWPRRKSRSQNPCLPLPFSLVVACTTVRRGLSTGSNRLSSVREICRPIEASAGSRHPTSHRLPRSAAFRRAEDAAYALPHWSASSARRRSPRACAGSPASLSDG